MINMNKTIVAGFIVDPGEVQQKANNVGSLFCSWSLQYHDMPASLKSSRKDFWNPVSKTQEIGEEVTKMEEFNLVCRWMLSLQKWKNSIVDRRS